MTNNLITVDSSVAGYCPMGCGRTLFVASGGHITCRFAACPNPTAVDDLLDERETEHIVHIDNNTWRMQHPLRERLDGNLFECAAHVYFSELDGPPRKPGRYRMASLVDGNRKHIRWWFTELCTALAEGGAS